MPQRPFHNAMGEASLRWRELAERRRAHFIELYETGRWRHYYTDQAFLAGMRDAVANADRWARIAPRPEELQTAR